MNSGSCSQKSSSWKWPINVGTSLEMSQQHCCFMCMWWNNRPLWRDKSSISSLSRKAARLRFFEDDRARWHSLNFEYDTILKAGKSNWLKDKSVLSHTTQTFFRHTSIADIFLWSRRSIPWEPEVFRTTGSFVSRAKDTSGEAAKNKGRFPFRKKPGNFGRSKSGISDW